VHNRDSQEIERLTQELSAVEENIYATHKDSLKLLFEFGQHERGYVEELEAFKRTNAIARIRLVGTVEKTAEQTELFSKHSELHTEDLANKFRQQFMRFTEETNIVKEQSEFLKKIMAARVDELEHKLAN